MNIGIFIKNTEVKASDPRNSTRNRLDHFMVFTISYHAINNVTDDF